MRSAVLRDLLRGDLARIYVAMRSEPGRPNEFSAQATNSDDSELLQTAEKMQAQLFQFVDRGVLRVGAFADVVVPAACISCL